MSKQTTDKRRRADPAIDAPLPPLTPAQRDELYRRAAGSPKTETGFRIAKREVSLEALKAETQKSLAQLIGRGADPLSAASAYIAIGAWAIQQKMGSDAAAQKLREIADQIGRPS